jgi:predicted DNA-binding antitoxin AbrB/MazE fold protein
MERTVEAVYENGVLRLLETLPFPNNQRVLVTIRVPVPVKQDLAGYFTPDEWESAARDPISLDEVRAALASIPGSLSDTVIESREDR